MKKQHTFHCLFLTDHYTPLLLKFVNNLKQTVKSFYLQPCWSDEEQPHVVTLTLMPPYVSQGSVSITTPHCGGFLVSVSLFYTVQCSCLTSISHSADSECAQPIRLERRMTAERLYRHLAGVL